MPSSRDKFAEFEATIIDYTIVSTIVRPLGQNTTTVILDRDPTKSYSLASDSLPVTQQCKGKKHRLRILETGELRILKNIDHLAP